MVPTEQAVKEHYERIEEADGAPLPEDNVRSIHVKHPDNAPGSLGDTGGGSDASTESWRDLDAHVPASMHKV